MTITPTYKFPSGYMGGHLPLATASLLSFLLTYLLILDSWSRYPIRCSSRREKEGYGGYIIRYSRYMS